MEHVIIFEGIGWYADLGRYANGQSYVEGRMIADPSQYGQDGYLTAEAEAELNEGLDSQDDAWQSPRIWDIRTGRGTPYWLDSDPE